MYILINPVFYNEVLSTLERARTENIGNENMILEINSLKWVTALKNWNMFISQGLILKGDKTSWV